MAALLGISCQPPGKKNDFKVGLVILDPGHFHAALVQKSTYTDVDSNVYVYAPKGPDVQLYLDKINAYNSAAQKPTNWNEHLYLADDFLEKMLSEKKGSIVVIAGNNNNKTAYIKKSIDAGLNVLADKPMVIDAEHFEQLQAAFASATTRKVLLYDIMTERFEITNLLQKEFAQIPEIFGVLEKGTSENPAIQMESVHYFYKFVSGNILTRPSWFMDVSQQGEAIADVATHLVDLVQWGYFPGKTIDYRKDIQINSARRWSTDMTLSQFAAITKQTAFPAYLQENVHDSLLQVFANGEINYQLMGTHIKLIAKWDYKENEGSGDTHNTLVRGTKANLIIRQGAAQNYKPTLYIEPADNNTVYEENLRQQLKKVQLSYPGVELKKADKGWEVIIPEKYKEGHEAHFARVTENFLGYLKNGNMPSWEIPNMLAKYYTTTQALQWAKKNKD